MSAFKLLLYCYISEFYVDLNKIINSKSVIQKVVILEVSSDKAIVKAKNLI